jgi:subtilisin family serine protease
MLPYGAEGVIEARDRQVPSLPLAIDPWEWAVGGATGADVVVAIIDSGVDEGHPAVRAVSRHLMAVRDEDGEVSVVEDPAPHDPVGHGTACAGIVQGLAPQCELVSIRVLDEDLRGYARMFAAGLDWATENGCHVANLSLSTANEAWFAALHDVVDAAYFAGIVLVGALNNMPRPSFPTEFASVVSVASLPVDERGALVYNPEGPAEFGAPGIDVRVPWLDHGYATVSGNSFAAPYVAGLVTAMKSKHPWLTPFQVKSVLQAMASNGSASGVTNRSGPATRSGRGS